MYDTGSYVCFSYSETGLLSIEYEIGGGGAIKRGGDATNRVVLGRAGV